MKTNAYPSPNQVPSQLRDEMAVTYSQTRMKFPPEIEAPGEQGGGNETRIRARTLRPQRSAVLLAAIESYGYF
jgi:hypothetical protein